MRIVLIAEGDTERQLARLLKAFLDQRADAAGKPQVGLETRGEINRARHKLEDRVNLELCKPDVVAVVGLIDVYPEFRDAAAAKACLAAAANHHPRFYAHAAQYEVEAWLLPYWDDICKRLRVNQGPPGGNLELVNQNHPPSQRLKELYQRAERKRKYAKTTEIYAILRGKDLTVAAERCSEFRAFLNTLLTLSDLEPLG